MALASLCSETTKFKGSHPAFTGFIVDHRLRQGSTEEAHKVAEELRRLRIEPHVLTLDWAKHGDPSALSNLESAARRLRYQALGTACRDQGIASLLVAHHADDQAETVMLRLLGGYMGLGLRGVKSSRPIPECAGMYGVSGSGEPRSLTTSSILTDRQQYHMQIEGGGVDLVRPLLPFTKDELIAYCEQAGVRRFEDYTNTDRTYTLRNTVRYFLSSNLLPSALQTPQLLSVATGVAGREDSMESMAQRSFQQAAIQIDRNACKASVQLPKASPSSVPVAAEAYSYKAILLRKVLSLVSPADDIPLQDLHKAVDHVFPESQNLARSPLNSTTTTSCQVAGVTMSKDNTDNDIVKLSLQRRPPTSKEIACQRQELLLTLSADEQNSMRRRAPQWHLWDNRYWVRVCRPETATPTNGLIDVQFLTPATLAALRNSLDRLQRRGLDRALKMAPGDLRFTLPAIVVTKLSDISVERATKGDIVVLPSLGWSVHGWRKWLKDEEGTAKRDKTCLYDVRYKSIDLGGGANHEHHSAPDEMRTSEG